MFLYFFYYFTQSFLNEPLRKAYLAFMIIYVIVSTIPQIIAALTDRDVMGYDRSRCKTFFDCLIRIILSLIQGEYLWALFVYNLNDVNYTYKEALSVSTSITRFSQMFLQVTMITILGINEVDNTVKALTIGFSGFQFVFNIIMVSCILAR